MCVCMAIVSIGHENKLSKVKAEVLQTRWHWRQTGQETWAVSLARLSKHLFWDKNQIEHTSGYHFSAHKKTVSPHDFDKYGRSKVDLFTELDTELGDSALSSECPQPTRSFFFSFFWSVSRPNCTCTVESLSLAPPTQPIDRKINKYIRHLKRTFRSCMYN